MNKSSALIVVAFVLCGALAFWTGAGYRASLGASGSAGRQPGLPLPGSGSLPQQGGQKPPDVIAGQVVSKQASGFVVRTSDGSMKTVLYASTTSAVLTSVSAESPGKISVGDTVFVSGSASGNAFEARAIQVSHSPPAPPAGTPASSAPGQ